MVHFFKIFFKFKVKITNNLINNHILGRTIFEKIFHSINTFFGWRIPASAQEITPEFEETLIEMAMARDAEMFPVSKKATISTPELDVTHPLFNGVDDVTIPSNAGNITNNELLQAFLGFKFEVLLFIPTERRNAIYIN